MRIPRTGYVCPTPCLPLFPSTLSPYYHMHTPHACLTQINIILYTRNLYAVEKHDIGLREPSDRKRTCRTVYGVHKKRIGVWFFKFYFRIDPTRVYPGVIELGGD